MKCMNNDCEYNEDLECIFYENADVARDCCPEFEPGEEE